MSDAISSPSAREASVGSAIRLAAEVVIRLSSVVATLWLTRSLGVTAFGEFLLYLSIGLIIAELCDLGLNTMVVPLIVRAPGSLKTLFLVKAVMTAAVAATAAMAIPVAAKVSGVGLSVLALSTGHFLGAGWIEIIGATLRALGRRVEEALLLFVFRFTLVGLVIGSPFGLNVPGVMRSYAVAVLPALLFGALLLNRRARVLSEASPHGRHARSCARLSLSDSTRISRFSPPGWSCSSFKPSTASM